MTLGEIKTKLTGRLNRRDFTADTSLQQAFIDEAILRIHRELRGPPLEKQVQVTIEAPYTGLVIPSDFLELISIIPEACNDRLDKVDITKARRLAQVTDIPTVYCRQGGVWILGHAPTVGSVVDLYYYAESTPLVNAGDSNILTLSAWDLILYAALAKAGDHYRDKKTADWEQEYQMSLSQLQGQADGDELDGTSGVQLTYPYPDDLGW